MKKLAHFAYYLVSQKPVSVIVVILAAFFLSFGAFQNVETADDFESGITDPLAIKTLAEFKGKFGSEQQVLVAFPIDGINRKSVLKLFDLVAMLKSHQEVKSVISALDLLRDLKDREKFQEYLQDFRLSNLKTLLQESNLFRNFLVSNDGKAFQLAVIPDTRHPDFQKRLYFILNDTLSSFFNDEPYHVFGFMYFKQRFFEFIEKNNQVFLSLGFIVCSCLAWFFFPDLVVLVLIIFSIAIPTVLTFALYFANGNKINIFTSPIIPFALIISLNEIIYLISFFVKNKKDEKLTYAQLHKNNFFKLLRPCFINSITTLIGFLTLSSSPSPNIRLFSLYTSLACFLAYFVTFGLIFSFLKLYQPSFALRPKKRKESQWLRKLLRNTIFHHTKKVLLVSLIVGAIGFPLIFSYQTRNQLEDSFAKDDSIVSSWQFIKENFSGPYQLMVMLSNPDLIAKPFLQNIETFQEELLTLPEVNRVFSVVDLVKAFGETFSSEASIPENEDLTRSILSFFDSKGISELVVANDLKSLLIRVSINISDDFKIYDLGKKIEFLARKHFPGTAQVNVTGENYAQALLQKDILENISTSFAMAIAIISLVFLITFRSFSLSFIALLVNFYPIFFAYAIANAIGIPLNPSTAVAGCVMSGLIVDDTLHMLTFFFDAKHKTVKRRLLATLQELTWPVIYSGILLGLGNLIFVFSDFKPFKYFGAIGALIVVIGIIGDLLVLPACILAIEKLTNKATE